MPVAISNGWEDDRGPAEWTTAERDQFLTLFRKRLAMPERVRFLTDDPAKILATRPDAPPAGDRLPEAAEAGVNWALAANGSQASASSQQTGPAQNWPAAGVIDGVRDDLGWGAGHGWASAFGQPLPQWIEVRFPSPRTIEQFCIVTFQTQLGTENAAKWGVKDYVIEVWDGEGAAVEGGCRREPRAHHEEPRPQARCTSAHGTVSRRDPQSWHPPMASRVSCRSKHGARRSSEPAGTGMRTYTCTHGLVDPACATVYATLL